MNTIKSELLLFTGFVLILTGTIVLEKPFIIRTFEKAASFGFLCDIAIPGNDGGTSSDHSTSSVLKAQL